MKNEITLSQKEENGFIYKFVHINFETKKEDIYFKIPSSEKELLTDSTNPFAVLTIFKMMETGGEIYLKGKISSSLLDNLEYFCNIWNVWLPHLYKPVKIIPDEEIKDDPVKLSKKAISCFSGGLDACFTAYRHKQQLTGRNYFDIEKSVMIYGADILLKQHEEFKFAFENAKKLTDDLGITLIPIETNFREFGHNWAMNFAVLFAASLMIFEKKYNYGLFASDSTLSVFPIIPEPWSSNPVTNNLLSSNNFKLITDGYTSGRTDKAKVVSKWKTALKYLRVCWYSTKDGLNCGICEKCVRTRMNFMAAGVNNVEFMPDNFSIDILLKTKIDSNEQIQMYKEIFNYAKKHKSLNKKIMKILNKVIKRNFRHVNNIKLPVFLGKFISFFILKEKNKRHFINKYIGRVQ